MDQDGWLLDTDWEELEKLLPKRRAPFRKKMRKGGRPRLSDRACFRAVLWLLAGSTWRTLPRELGAPKNVLARIKQWRRSGALVRLWRAYLALTDGPRAQHWEWLFRRDRQRAEWQAKLVDVYRWESSRKARLADWLIAHENAVWDWDD